MEGPFPAFHLTRATLSLRRFGAEPHTKEACRDAVGPQDRVHRADAYHERVAVLAREQNFVPERHRRGETWRAPALGRPRRSRGQSRHRATPRSPHRSAGSDGRRTGIGDATYAVSLLERHTTRHHAENSPRSRLIRSVTIPRVRAPLAVGSARVRRRC